MHPNFMQFCQKISFKSAIEIFTPVSGYLRTVLNVVIFSPMIGLKLNLNSLGIGTKYTLVLTTS